MSFTKDGLVFDNPTEAKKYFHAQRARGFFWADYGRLTGDGVFTLTLAGSRMFGSVDETPAEDSAAAQFRKRLFQAMSTYVVRRGQPINVYIQREGQADLLVARLTPR